MQARLTLTFEHLTPEERERVRECAEKQFNSQEYWGEHQWTGVALVNPAYSDPTYYLGAFWKAIGRHVHTVASYCATGEYAIPKET